MSRARPAIGRKRMNRFVPMEKQSKKAQPAYYARQRSGWGGVKLVTRIMEDRKRLTAKARRKEHELLEKYDLQYTS